MYDSSQVSGSRLNSHFHYLDSYGPEQFTSKSEIISIRLCQRTELLTHAGVTEVVNNNSTVSGIEDFHCGVTANVASAACHQHTALAPHAWLITVPHGCWCWSEWVWSVMFCGSCKWRQIVMEWVRNQNCPEHSACWMSIRIEVNVSQKSSQSRKCPSKQNIYMMSEC